MKRKIMLIGIVFILIIESVFIYNLFKPNKSQILENIKTVDVFDNKDKTLSIMVQDPTTFQYTEDTSRTAWPSREEYMYAGTKCTDKDGTDIGDTTQYISFTETNPNPTVTIKTKKTIYCTLYFANGRPTLEVLDNKGGIYYGSGDTIGKGVKGSRQAVNGLYRFKGTASQVTNNYICLGSENPDTCKSNPDNMYRIIGVTDGSNDQSSYGLEAGYLKVIKALPSSDSLTYGSSYDDGRDWDSIPMQTDYLNNTFYNSNTIDSRIKNLIQSVQWYKGRVPYGDYRVEVGNMSSAHKIGLVYASDYYNSWTYATNTNSWLHTCHGWISGAPNCGKANYREWTMTGAINDSGYWSVMQIYPDGSLSGLKPNNSGAVRPVFYLSNKIGLIGEGITTHPYTVTNIK